MTKKICISGYYGFNNFGDETILKTLIENISDNEITVFSSNPEQTGKQYKVKSVQTFDILKVTTALLKCDCLISGGGSLLQDTTSTKSLLYYLGVLFIAQFFRKKTIIFAQGIGPISNKFFAKITAMILKKAYYVCVRDIDSINLLKSWGIKSTLVCDPVWNIPESNAPKSHKIGVQLRQHKYLTDEFIQKLATYINKYFPNREVIILSLQNEQDLDAAHKLKELLEHAEVKENTSNQTVIEDIASLDAIIAMRYHACLIAIKNNVKLLPISYDIKVETLSKEFKLNYIDLSKSENLEEIFSEFINKTIKYEQNKNFDFNTIRNLIS